MKSYSYSYICLVFIMALHFVIVHLHIGVIGYIWSNDTLV